MTSPLSGSWKTTLAGIVTILGALLTLAKAAQAGPINTTDMTVAGTAIVTALGLIFARDNSVSSEEVGATPGQKQAVADIHAAAVAAPAPAAPVTPLLTAPKTP